MHMTQTQFISSFQYKILGKKSSMNETYTFANCTKISIPINCFAPMTSDAPTYLRTCFAGVSTSNRALKCHVIKRVDKGYL